MRHRVRLVDRCVLRRQERVVRVARDFMHDCSGELLHGRWRVAVGGRRVLRTKSARGCACAGPRILVYRVVACHEFDVFSSLLQKQNRH